MGSALLCASSSAGPRFRSAPQNFPIPAPTQPLCLPDKGGFMRVGAPPHCSGSSLPRLLGGKGAQAGEVPRAALPICSPQRAARPGELKGEPQTKSQVCTPPPPRRLVPFQAVGGDFHTVALSSLWPALLDSRLAQAQGVGKSPWPSPTRSQPPPACPQLLNCITDMAEKTRRSLTVLRQCQEADREELNHWIRRYSDTEDAKKGPMPATARPLNSSAGTEGSQLGVCRGGVVGGRGCTAGAARTKTSSPVSALQ